MDNKLINDYLRQNAQTIVLLGKPGCGKHTQSKLFVKYLNGLSPRRSVVVETGELFRNWLPKIAPWLGKRLIERQKSGRLQSHVHALKLWMSELEKRVETGDEHLIFDGSPRSVAELPDFESYMEDIGREPLYVLIDISDETARNQMAGRNRTLIENGGEARMETSTDEAIELRLRQFHEITQPMIEVIQSEEKLARINGEAPVETVHKELLIAAGVRMPAWA